MALSTVNPTQTPAWQKLEQHFKSMQSVSMKTLFQQDPARAEKMHIQWNDFMVDFSKNRITEETVNLLLQLAEEAQLKSAIHDYFTGVAINQTEGRAVLHTALRSTSTAPLLVDGVNIVPEIQAVKNKIQAF
jgi:glucose-6-phosphate isomerase